MTCAMCKAAAAVPGSQFCAGCRGEMDQDNAMDRTHFDYDYEESKLGGFSQRTLADFAYQERLTFLHEEGRARIEQERHG